MIFEYQNKSVYYEIHGQGEPILILNGIMMSTKSWQEFVDPFSAQHQLILVDFLDQGQSSKVFEAYTHHLQVDMIIAFLEYLAIGPVNLYGVSYGGEIAIQTVLKAPHLIKKLILFNTCGETTYWLEEVGNAWNAASHDGLAYYLTTIPFIYSPKFFVEKAEWMARRKEILIPIFSNPEFIESMIRLTNSSVGYQVMDRLAEIEVPTLIAGCQYDFVTPFYQQEQLHQGIKNSQIVYVPDSGHALMYEKPSLFVSLVLGFVGNIKQNFVL